MKINKNDKSEERQSKEKEYLEGWQRAQADYQNLKRECDEKMKKFAKMAVVDFVISLLPIIDHFEMAIQHVPDEQKDKEWVKGFYHIKKQFDELLDGYEMKKIATIGEKFDPNLHEAISQEESDKDKDEIIKEVQSGYVIGDYVVRHAKVIVSK
jgi:molecular chaperone GrpE